MNKQNCWEYKKCGREPGGISVDDEGICPAAIETRTHGINGGTNGGRTCWAVTGTHCGGIKQVSLASKLITCTQDCKFYHKVQEDEQEGYMNSAKILNLLPM